MTNRSGIGPKGTLSENRLVCGYTFVIHVKDVNMLSVLVLALPVVVLLLFFLGVGGAQTRFDRLCSSWSSSWS